MLDELKMVCVTGASRGIGKAFVDELIQRRPGVHSFLLISRGQPDSEQIANWLKLGAVSVEFFSFDFSLSEHRLQAHDLLRGRSVDLLFNNAGLLTGGPLQDQSVPEIESVTSVNLAAPMVLTQAVLPSMLEKKRGMIVNHASITGVMNFPLATTYAASKAGLIAFTRSLQSEIRGTGVETLTLFTPGVKTEMFDAISDKYNKKGLEIDLSAVTPEVYAKRIADAIERKKAELRPPGVPGFAMRFSEMFPQTFGALSSRMYKKQHLKKSVD